jgi:hypothetical protein
MSLEALFLKGSERFELSRRLAQRVAKVLSCTRNNPIDVHKHIKEAYGLRSQYVHGGQLTAQKKKKLRSITPDIIDYTRKSLIIFLQLLQIMKKPKLLDLIDEALLIEKSFVRLANFIKTLPVSV